MTSVRNWELCVAEMKKRSGKPQKLFTFLSGPDLEKVQKCYCTMSRAKKSTNNTKKNGSK
jgi:hypothetical protein